MSANLPLTWADKKNSPLLADFIAKYGAQFCMTAEEINQLRDAVNEMAVVQQSVYMGTVVPMDIPTGVGARFWMSVTPGKYNNHGGVVVNANSMAIISVTATNVFSVSQNLFDFSGYVKTEDNNKSNPWTAKVYPKDEVVVYLGKYWVANVDTLATDVPGTSSKWVEVLNGYEREDSESISKKYYTDIDGKEYTISDSFGNIIFKADEFGIAAKNAKFNNLNVGNVNIENFETKVLISEEDNFSVCDSFGNIIFKASDKEVKFIGDVNAGHRLKGKKFKTIGDSLDTAPNYFSKQFESMTGSVYEGSFSSGGSNSIPNFSNSMQDRVKLFIDSSPSSDFVIFENVNDDWQAISSNLGTFETKKPFFISQYFEYANGFVTRQAALDYWNANFSSIASGVQNKTKGTCVRIKYDTNSYLITVTGSATKDGVITIAVGSVNYSTSVLNGDNANAIASKLFITNYNGYDKTLSGSVMTLKENITGAGAVSVLSNTTGATVVKSSSSSSSYINKYFMGTVEAEFLVKANWDDELSLYSSYKGMIEALSSINIQIYWLIPSKFNLTWTPTNPSYNASVVNSDGTFNMNALILTQDFVKYKALVNLQIEVCKRYAIRYANCQEESGINPFNIKTFYNENDVHPKTLTYTVWAEVMKKEFN
jgi:hypothetical protein